MGLSHILSRDTKPQSLGEECKRKASQAYYGESLALHWRSLELSQGIVRQAGLYNPAGVPMKLGCRVDNGSFPKSSGLRITWPQKKSYTREKEGMR